MARYKYFDQSQGLFLTVCLDQQLIPGSFEHTVNYLIDRFDLSAFDAAFRNDQLGAPAYPPMSCSRLFPRHYHQPPQAKSGDCKECKLRQRRIAVRGGNSPKRTLHKVDRNGEENLCEKMRNKIDETKYRVLYGRRMQIIEPCFSDISYCKGMDRFSLGTKTKVTIQWLLYCMAHNIGNCMLGIMAESGA